MYLRNLNLKWTIKADFSHCLIFLLKKKSVKSMHARVCNDLNTAFLPVCDFMSCTYF